MSEQILGGPDEANIDLLLDRVNISLPKPQVSRPGRKQARRLFTGIGSLGETRTRLGVGCAGPGGLSSLSFPLAEERTQVQFLTRQVSNYLEYHPSYAQWLALYLEPLNPFSL